MMGRLTGGEEYDDFHGGVLELIDAQSAQMIGEVDHALDARAQTEGSGLLQRDGFAVRNADLARSGHRPVAAGEQQQLTPSVDQQRYLIIYLDIFEERKTFTPFDNFI